MISLLTNQLVISISKHPTAGINKWQWDVVDAWKYGLEWLVSPTKFDSEELAKANWVEFAKLNNISDYRYYGENTIQIADVRTGSGVMQ